ncbi:Fungal-trans domain-containing protein [Fusarium sp. LHS14.1]|nr:Fungal-trans domain-containing protein [Fusarium sp. LHS14.1]
MVMALGSHYSSTNNMWHGYSASVQFYDMANEQLQKESSRITFASLQARLLVTHYLLNHSRTHEAWSTFGLVVRQVQALGIHRRSPRPPSDHRIGEYRKRLFWVIYINDRILSSVFGRPCAIHDNDVDQKECTLANDEDITVSECKTVPDGTFCSAAALIHYARIARIARILGRILREFYRPAIKNQTISQLSESAAEFDRLLNEWQDSLPAYLNYVVLPPLALSVTTHRQMCTLKLAFAQASLLLYRPFILYSMETTLRKTAYLEDWVKRCHDKSIAAANMVVSKCKYLHQRGLFTRALWLVNYMQFAAIGTLYMYSHLWPGASHVREVAEEARAQLPVGVEGDLVGQRYVEMLEGLSKATLSPIEQGLDMGDVVDFDMSNVDLTGPWSNFFF